MHVVADCTSAATSRPQGEGFIMHNPNGASDSQIILEKARPPVGISAQVLSAWPDLSR